MSEKMLVTQALDERDLLVKKIADKIAKAKGPTISINPLLLNNKHKKQELGKDTSHPNSYFLCLHQKGARS